MLLRAICSVGRFTLDLARLLPTRLCALLQAGGKGASRQAYLKRRKEIRPLAASLIRERLTESFYQSRPGVDHLSGYLPLAVDSTTLMLPESAALASRFGRHAGALGKRRPVGARLHLVYDALNQMPLASSLTHLETGERQVLASLLPDLERRAKAIERLGLRPVLLLDAGYCSLALFGQMSSHKQGFICRVKGGFAPELSAPLCLAEPLAPKAICEQKVAFSQGRAIKGGKLKADLELRVIELWLGPGAGCLRLCTNLDKASLPASLVLRLYLERVRVESCFGLLKHALELEAFSAKSPQGIQTEIQAALTALTLTALVERAAFSKSKAAKEQRGHYYHALVENLSLGKPRPAPATITQPNRSLIFGLVREHIPHLLDPAKMKATYKKLIRQVAKLSCQVTLGRFPARSNKQPRRHQIIRRRVT